MFLLVPAYPGCPGSKAVKRSLLLLFFTGMCRTSSPLITSLNVFQHSSIGSEYSNSRQSMVDSSCHMAVKLPLAESEVPVRSCWLFTPVEYRQLIFQCNIEWLLSANFSNRCKLSTALGVSEVISGVMLKIKVGIPVTQPNSRWHIAHCNHIQRRLCRAIAAMTNSADYIGYL